MDDEREGSGLQCGSYYRRVLHEGETEKAAAAKRREFANICKIKTIQIMSQKHVVDIF